MTPEGIVSILLLAALLIAIVIDIKAQRKVIRLMDCIQAEVESLKQEEDENGQA